MQKPVLAIIAVAAVACSGIGPFEQTPSGEIRIDPGQVTIGAIGARQQLSLVDGGGAPIPGSQVSWRTSDPSVAVVNGSGMVTAEGDGQAVVTAAVGNREATAVVEVAATLEVLVEVTAADQGDDDPSDNRVVATITVVAP